MPETLRASDPNRLQAIVSALRSLIEGTEAEIAASVVATEPVTEPATSTDLSTFAGKGGKGRLFVELRQFAEAPDWAQIIPQPGIFLHDWYGDIVITAERNARFVQNYRDRIYGQEIPVDAEHETKLSGAFGWIRELRLNDDHSVDARIEWNDRGRLAFEQESYRYLSPEWYDLWQDPMTGKWHYDVLIGLALTTRPFFKEAALAPLLPLVASEAGLTAPEGGPPHRPSAAPAVAAADPITPPESTEPTTHATSEGAISMSDPKTTIETPAPVTLTDEQAKAFAESQDLIRQFREELTTANGEITKLSERNTALETANATATATERVRRFTDEVRGRSDANPNLWAGEIEQNVGVLVAMAESLGEDSVAFTTHVATQRAIAAQLKTSNLFSAIGSSQGGEDASEADTASRKAAELMSKDDSLSLREALSRVFHEQPELYEAHRKASDRD